MFIWYLKTYTNITVITENINPFLKCIKPVRTDADLLIEIYRKIIVPDTLGNIYFIVKCKKTS